jgi:hypothetical protein
MTKRQMLTEAFRRAGISLDTSPNALTIFTNSGVTYIETKFFGIGSKVPAANKGALEKALFEVFGAYEIYVSYDIVVKVRRGPK